MTSALYPQTNAGMVTVLRDSPQPAEIWLAQRMSGGNEVVFRVFVPQTETVMPDSHVPDITGAGMTPGIK